MGQRTSQYTKSHGYENLLSCNNDDKCAEDVSYEYNYDQEIELSQHTSSSKNMSKISYSDLVTKAKELVSVVQNDQSLMQSMFTSFSEWMEKIRRDSNVEVKIISRCTNDLSIINTTVNTIPLPGFINAVSVASNIGKCLVLKYKGNVKGNRMEINTLH